LLRTLSELHEAGVVVKDIKPENVLIDKYARAGVVVTMIFP
jgi:serine/threonine protein kinase